MKNIVTLLGSMLISLTVFANTNPCLYDLVANKHYPIPKAKETCELNACGYDLVVNKYLEISTAIDTCK